MITALAGYGRSRGFLAVSTVVLVAAVSVMVSLAAPDARAAGVASFSNASPTPGGAAVALPLVISVDADDVAKVQEDAVITLDGVDYSVEVDYFVGHWGAQGCEVVWIVDDWTQARVQTTLPTIADGSHDVTVTITNTDSDVSTYAWSFSAMISPDIVAITPANGAVITDTAPVISGRVTDNDATLDATLTVDGVPVATTYDPGTRTYSYTPSPPLADFADHSVELTVEDPAGNVTSRAWTFRVQTAAAASASQHIPLPGATLETSRTALGVRIDGEERIRLQDVSLFLDGSPVAGETSYPIGHWQNVGCEVQWVVDDDSIVQVSGAAPPLGDGVHTVRTEFTDALGLDGAEEWTFTVSEPPTVTAASPSGGTTDTTPPITAVIRDNGPGSVDSTMTVDGVAVPATFDGGSGVLSYQPVMPLADRTFHDVRIDMRDAAGNESVKEWVFRVQATADTTYSAAMPSPGAVVEVATPAISVVATDLAPLPLDGAIMYVDGTAVAATVVHGADETQATISFTPANLPDGQHTIRVEYINGWMLPSSYEWDFTVEAPPVIGVPAPADGSIVETLSPLLEADLFDNSGTAMSLSVEIDGAAVHSDVVTSGPWAWRVTPALADDLTHTVHLSLSDLGGNVATETWSFIVEGIPAIPQDLACTTCHTAYPVPDHPMDDCAGCHADLDGHGRLLPTTPVKGCSCHGSAQHSADRLLNPYGYEWDCEDCHQPQYPWIPTHDDEAVALQHYTTQDMTTCRPCHVGALTREHNRTPSGGGDPYDCDVCHASADPAVLAAIASDDTRCDSCHPAALHQSVHETAPEARCQGCHGGDISTAHVLKLGYGCDVCHESVDPNVQAVITAGNADCVDCHDPPAGNHAFTAPTVSLTACRTCHWTPRHFGDDCQRCHPPFPADAPYYDAIKFTEYGYFDSSASLLTDAAELHRIHVEGSWVQDYFMLSGCGSCHAPAQCEACHGPVSHGEHTFDADTGTYAYGPVREVNAPGSTTLRRNTAKTRSSTCVTAECHARASVETTAFASPDCAGCHG